MKPGDDPAGCRAGGPELADCLYPEDTPRGGGREGYFPDFAAPRFFCADSLAARSGDAFLNATLTV